MTMHKLAYSRNITLVDYGKEVEQEIVLLQGMIEENEALKELYFPRWLALKLLEADSNIQHRIAPLPGAAELLAKADERIEHLEKIYGDDLDTFIADRRYGWINGLVRETVRRSRQDRLNISDNIDKVVANRILGIPIFFVMMWFVFKFATDVAGPFLDWIEIVISGPISNWAAAIIGVIGLGGTWVESLVVDGIIAGVGGVLVFVPVLMSLYLALAVLEDSGYMARAAFVMDRLMHVLGLHGKSFLPMIVGFGCTVPAFYATRTLENERDRILTGLLVPFMSCGARLPVYVLFAAIFFPQNAGTVIFLIYMIGIATAVLVGLLLKNTLFKTDHQAPFVMELPPYRMPTIKAIWANMWERTSSFVRKAWTVIMLVSAVIWLLLAIPLGGGTFAEVEIGSSLYAGMSRAVAPVFSPAGFGSWEASGSLVTGLVAKEVIVGTMAQVFEVEEIAQEAEAATFFEDVGEIVTGFVGAAIDTVKSLPLLVGIDLFEEESQVAPTGLMLAIEDSFEKSSGGHSALAGFSFMVFALLYTPCVVAIVAERQELGRKWMWLTIIGQSVLAWLAAVLIFQLGVLLGLG